MEEGSSKYPPPERGARRGSHDSIDDVFLELKLAEADISSSSSDEETGILEESGGSSFFFSSLDSRETKIVTLPNAATGDVPTDLEDDETIKDGLPAGFERLPSAMRPPVAAVVAARAKRHCRSASTGGSFAFSGYQRPGLVAMTTATLPAPLDEKEERESQLMQSQVASHGFSNNFAMPPSALKKQSLPNTVSGHRRVFSHGQISFVGSPQEVGLGAILPTGMTNEGPRGHRRTGSKTDFILPPGHEARERKRSIHRSGSKRIADPVVEGADPTVAGLSSAPPSGRHRRIHSRSDSLGFSFRGHSRQASRTESIYTLRPLAPISTPSKLFFWNRSKKPSNDEEETEECTRNRTVVPNHTIPVDVPPDKHPNRAYTDNFIRTTKYTILTFLPKNLFEQFHRFANLYFLFIVLLNWVPAINAFGKEISMMPVIFVLGVTAIKDIFEDRRRYLSDKRVNNSTCRVFKSTLGRYVKSLWADIRVGDLVHLSHNEMIPADILVLRSSDEHGLCYIDTQNLDGEANLKQREVPRGFIERQSVFKPQDFRSTLECDLPTTKIYRFHGSIMHPWGERVPVGKDNLLLRECVLKNTDFVEGIVVYAGHESKAMLNNGGPRYKRSKLERQMNIEIVWCVVTLLVLCLIGAVGSGLWLESLTSLDRLYVAPFLSSAPSPGFEGFLTFWTFIIIFQVIIPLSLYVTIELTKLAQIYLIHQDSLMFDEVCQKRVECRALNIPEELGQIQYIFCDKTGTLTENNMVFKRCTIGGADFGHNTFTTRFNAATPRASGTSTSTTTTSLSSISQQVFMPSTGRAIIPVNPSLSDRLCSLDIQFLLDGKDTKAKAHAEAILTRDFFLLLAICNTVIVAKYPHRDAMNASGLITSTSVPTGNGKNNKYLKRTLQESFDHDGSFIRESNANYNGTSRASVIGEEETFKVSSSPTPPMSLVSNSTTTTTASSSTVALAGPLQPEPALSTPKRPNRFLGLFPPAKPPLSPITSSPEMSPNAESSPAFPRQKQLNLPHILSKLVPSGSLTSLVKGSHNQTSRAATPTPYEIQPIYEAESPDELALVDAACAYSCRLLRRTPGAVVVSLPGEGVVEFEVLHVLPFDSVRKRMSIIVRHPVTRDRILLCKGADSAIFPRLERPDTREEEELVEKTQLNLDNYAKQGLRVLVMAKRILHEEEYVDWLANHRDAENSLQRRDRLLWESYNRMEARLKLLGATGIEDKLQEGVPETIANLREAGIVVWVLTGDKQETAINIAYSCKLFNQDMEIIKLNARSRDAAENTIKFYLEQINKEANSDPSKLENDGSKIHQRASLLKRKKRALVVDGKTLVYILDKRANLQEDFLKLTSHCSSVLGCRATPLQKAYIVRIVKEELKMHTLAIGDGANDVSMIQTADVGIGISGMEGMQAVMASDFAISRFKYLERLLLVHGHWNYDRLARMVLYFFYKNAAFVFVCFWYQIYCGWSGTVMIDQMYLMLYNFLFTSLPPMAIGIYDQDAPDTVLSSQPTLYSQGRLGQVYQRHSFWLNMFDAMYQSLVIFFVAVGTYNQSDAGIWEFGTVICTSCLAVMLAHLAVETKSWTIIHWCSILLSVFLYFLFALLYNGFCITCFGLQNPFWVLQYSMGTAEFWLVGVLTCVLAVLPRLTIRAFCHTRFPTPVTKVMLERQKLEKGGSERDGMNSSEPRITWSSRATSQASVLRPSRYAGSDQNSTEMTTVGQ